MYLSEISCTFNKGADALRHLCESTKSHQYLLQRYQIVSVPLEKALNSTGTFGTSRNLYLLKRFGCCIVRFQKVPNSISTFSKGTKPHQYIFKRYPTFDKNRYIFKWKGTSKRYLCCFKLSVPFAYIFGTSSFYSVGEKEWQQQKRFLREETDRFF